MINSRFIGIVGILIIDVVTFLVAVGALLTAASAKLYGRIRFAGRLGWIYFPCSAED